MAASSCSPARARKKASASPTASTPRIPMVSGALCPRSCRQTGPRFRSLLGSAMSDQRTRRGGGRRDGGDPRQGFEVRYPQQPARPGRHLTLAQFCERLVGMHQRQPERVREILLPERKRDGIAPFGKAERVDAPEKMHEGPGHALDRRALPDRCQRLAEETFLVRGKPGQVEGAFGVVLVKFP